MSAAPHLAEDVQELKAESKEQQGSIDGLREDVQGIKRQVAKIQTDTSELLEILNAVKGGLKVLGFLGKIFKWVAGIATAVVALWKTLGWKAPWH